MVKDINVHTSYEGKGHIIECPQTNFIKKAAEHFKLNPADILLFAVNKGQKRQISCSEITGVMKVEIVLKNASEKPINQSSEQLPNINHEQIVSKLESNSPLTDSQRKALSDLLERYTNLPLSVKRKFKEGENIQKKAHKKVQVFPSTHNASSQTDGPAVSHLRGDPDRELMDQIKRLANCENPDEEQVNKLMSESYEDRRHYILVKNPQVIAVRNQYPLLFSATQVMNELDRLFYPDKQKEFLQNIGKYSKPILSLGKKNMSEISKVQSSLTACQTAHQRKYVEEVGSILLLPKLMEETIGFINLTDNRVDDVYPYIDAGDMDHNQLYFADESTSFKIIVEGQLLCKVKNLKDALLCLCACFFIFNINYPDVCYKTLVVFEKLYLTANDTYEYDDFTEQMIKLLKIKAGESH